MARRQASILGEIRIAIKGAGEMATGVAVRLYRAGFTSILMLETERPLAVRRAVSFCEAVYDRRHEVEGIPAVRLDSRDELERVWEDGGIAVAVDPGWKALEWYSPMVVVDAILAKRNLGTRMGEAPLVLALGPGFAAGVDAHRVVETNRGHNLGRIFTAGSAEPNTGIPGNIGGYTSERVLRAPVSGRVSARLSIGEMAAVGDVVCEVGGVPVAAAIAGVVRGCVRPGIEVEKGVKLGDIDPRGVRDYCFTVSEKARALGGSVLEAICADLPDLLP